MCWEKIVHDNKVNLVSSRKLDSVETIEPVGTLRNNSRERMISCIPGNKGVRIILDMSIIVLQYSPKPLVFSSTDSFDNEPVVSRVIKEAA